jgi:hypothetical protein
MFFVFFSPAFVMAAKVAAKARKAKAANPEMEAFAAKAVSEAKKATADSARRAVPRYLYY